MSTTKTHCIIWKIMQSHFMSDDKIYGFQEIARARRQTNYLTGRSLGSSVKWRGTAHKTLCTGVILSPNTLWQFTILWLISNCLWALCTQYNNNNNSSYYNKNNTNNKNSTNKGYSNHSFSISVKIVVDFTTTHWFLRSGLVKLSGIFFYIFRIIY